MTAVKSDKSLFFVIFFINANIVIPDEIIDNITVNLREVNIDVKIEKIPLI